MKSKPENIFRTKLQDFNQYAANFIKSKLEKIDKKQTINVALSGGSTPIPVLNILKDYKLNWKKINFFLVDERFVNVNSNQSNYKNINESFFKFISSNHFPVLKEGFKIDEIVANYNSEIKKNLKFIKPNIPKFDIILLGMGNDGHTASLFPNSKALDEQNDFVVKNYVPQLDSYRVTLTYPTLLNCKESIVLIKGEEKDRIFNKILNGEGDNFPITKLLNSNINWIIGK